MSGCFSATGQELTFWLGFRYDDQNAADRTYGQLPGRGVTATPMADPQPQ